MGWNFCMYLKNIWVYRCHHFIKQRIWIHTDLNTIIWASERVPFGFMWMLFANRFRSLWLVKVCQWVTLTPARGFGEGGAGELGHMVAHCSLLETVPARPVLPAFIAAYFLYRLWMGCGVFLGVAQLYRKQTGCVFLREQKGFATVFEEEKLASENSTARFDVTFWLPV